MKHEKRILTYSRLSEVNFSKHWLLGRVDLRICTYFTPPRSEATEKGEGRGVKGGGGRGKRKLGFG